MAIFAAADAVVASVVASAGRLTLAKMSCLPTLAGMKPALLLIPALLVLAGCGVQQSQPAPTPDADRWGHLPPDPERPQQAGRAGVARPISRS